jgi:hypothetical protein
MDVKADVTTRRGNASFFVNSAFAFACAELLTAAFHECGHGLVAQALGFAPRVYAFYENNPTGSAAQTLEILAAGPFASLFSGAAFWIWYARSGPRYGFGRLLLLWLALLGVMEFVNYLIVTPWLGAGDTAQFADVLGWPVAARYAVAAAGVAMLVALARPAAAAIFSVAPQAVPLDTASARRRFILRGFYLPLVVGVFLTALAGVRSAPIFVGYGLLGTFGNIDIVVAAMYAGLAAPAADARMASDAPLRVEPAGIALYAALVLVYVLFFSRGVPI